ncbi:MAG TPA: electron transport complex subunit RsxG [Xanthomonadaceae bacterium]|nr:electron transport complex subunit RsxG [Xanthomonadaceae bacterium]
MNGGRAAARAALLLGTCAVLAVVLLAGVHELTREPIAEAERAAELQALAMVLPPDRYDNDPFEDRVRVQAEAWLGAAPAVTVRRARLQGRPSALVVPVVAADGYAGPIHLLVGIDTQGRILGARILRHQETPGLGDWIDAGKSDWIDRFRGRWLGDPPVPRWRVRKDGGDFDAFAGATVTPRAVVAALRRALQYVRRHGQELYAAPAGSELRHSDGPPPPGSDAAATEPAP